MSLVSQYFLCNVQVSIKLEERYKLKCLLIDRTFYQGDNPQYVTRNSKGFL